MPAFVATAAVTFIFTGASNSTARTIPTADAVYLAAGVWDSTGDTVAATIAGAAPTESYQNVTASGERNYFAVFVGAPAGSQTVVISGGDAGDGWSCGYRGIDDIDTVDPFDNTVTDTASPASISVTTTSDGLACGVIMADNVGVSTTDTEVFEAPQEPTNTVCINCASTPGTGGAVSIDWTAGGTTLAISIAANLRQVAAAGGTILPKMIEQGLYTGGTR
jgi:hypothetical protein